MFSISEMTYYIGERVLYENASISIDSKDKIGLVGLNGSGKSTLLKIINGECSPDKGHINKSKECSIGFLNQDLLSYQTDDSILSVAMSAFKDAVDIQTKIDQLINQLETDYSEKMVNHLAELQEKFEQLEGYTLQAKAAELLEGIGFSTAELQRPLKTFSGGWRMRVILAKLLLEKPFLLMLDEPTNHLDLPSIEWIENYLQNYPGAIIVVSHDKQFLDRVTTKTVEVSRQQLTTYEGNYSFYLEEKQQREAIQQNAYINQQKTIKQTEQFIARFRAKSTKAKQVQSRLKALGRMTKIDEVVQDDTKINFNFTIAKASGKRVTTLSKIDKSYASTHILKETDASIERGDKIALIGANGKGKSTLLRLIAGNEPINAGQRSTGHNVIKGFYAQHQLEALNLENEVLEELKQAGSGKTEQELRNILGCLLFANEDVFKKIKVLSGGEKSRVALAKTLISEANFLILDEPTNHLDFLSENILIQALQQYKGSFIVVSHNRHFIRETANKIWYIEDLKIKEYPGGYEEYEYKQVTTQNNKKTQKTENKPRKKRNSPHPTPTDTADKQSGRLQKELQHIEQILAQQQQKKSEIETEMATPETYNNLERITKMKEMLKKTEKDIAKTFEKWESIAEEIDRTENITP